MRLANRLTSFFAAASLLWFASGCAQQADGAQKQPQVPAAVTYVLLEDDMESWIVIGVKPDVTENELKTILRNAANEHQDDSARDYMLQTSFRVEALLVKGGLRSGVPAGVLRRPVPFKNPQERKKLKDDRTKYDKISITLENARLSLK
jgi:hypothetical protein